MLAKLNDIINDYLFNKISLQEFEEKIGKKYQFQEFNQLLNESIQSNTELKRNRLFHNLFWYLPVQLSEIEKDLIYKTYLDLHVGHYEHEDMLDHFHNNFIEPEVNIDILVSLVENPPSYFVEDYREKLLQKKCLVTISRQPTVKAKKTLETFSLSIDDTISRASKLYLEKLTKNVQ